MNNIPETQFDVILIEDNDEDAELTLRVFQNSKLVHSALHFRNAELAYEYLTNHSAFPKLVLTDLNLGGMSGLELLKLLNADRKTEALTTAILTGSDPRDIDHQFYQLDAILLVKPLDITKLKKLMDKCG